jgi:hypothetical protein
MDLLAPILAYLGAVAGIVVAIVLSYNSLIYKPLDAPRMPQAAATMVAKSSAPKMPKPKARRKAEIGRAPVHVNRSIADVARTRIAAPQRLNRAKERSRRAANERWWRRLAHGRQSAPKQWAYRPVPRAPYALGYAEMPHASFGNSGFE